MTIFTDIEEMQALGASEQEILLYRQNKIQEMRAIGASDEEISIQLGTPKIDATTQKKYWQDLEETRPLTFTEEAEQK